MYGLEKNNNLYSFIDPVKMRIAFAVSNKQFVGCTRVLNNDIKAIRNYQLDTLKLLEKTMIDKKADTKWKRSKNWFNDYEYIIENNIIWIYRQADNIARFKLPCNDITLLEYFLKNQFKLLDKFIKPQKSK